MSVRIAERLGYRKSHHQIAKATVPMMAVTAVEINNESEANLIQSSTCSQFPVGSIAERRRNCRVSASLPRVLFVKIF